MGIRTRSNGQRVSAVVVRLEVCIAERLVEALNHGLNRQLRRERERVGKDVACREVDHLHQQVVFEHDEASRDGGRVGKDVLPVLQNLRRADRAAGDLEICVIA